MATYKDKITKTRIEKLTVGDKLWDLELSGFHVFKQKTKTSFYYKYRINEKQALASLGAFGTISIDDAKDKARKYFLLASDGIDPVQYLKYQAEELRKKTEKEQYSIADTYKDWELHFKPKLKTSSLSEWTLYGRYVEPVFADRPLIDIRPEEINAFHASIEKPYSANRSIKIMKKLYSVARRFEKFEGNEPFIALELNPERKRRRHLTGDEPKRLYQVLESYKDRGEEEFKARCCVLLYLLTSARKKEWLDTPKEWVDLETGILSLPDTKNNEPDEKILPVAAIDILIELFERHPNSPWVFPSPRKIGFPLENIKRHWNIIRQEADIKDIRLHDLRRTFASIALSSDISLDQIGEILNHKNVNTTKGYAYLINDKKRIATEHVAENIIALLTEE